MFSTDVVPAYILHLVCERVSAFYGYIMYICLSVRIVYAIYRARAILLYSRALFFIPGKLGDQNVQASCSCAFVECAESVLLLVCFTVRVCATPTETNTRGRCAMT